jgi:hypothetical protein
MHSDSDPPRTRHRGQSATRSRSSYAGAGKTYGAAFRKRTVADFVPPSRAEAEARQLARLNFTPDVDPPDYDDRNPPIAQTPDDIAVDVADFLKEQEARRPAFDDDAPEGDD